MSRSFVACLLDLDRFAAVCGSGDQGLLRRVIETRAEEIAAIDKFERDWDASAPYTPLAQVIDHVIAGRLHAQVSPVGQFERAAILIADVLGEPLDSECLAEMHEEFCEEVDVAIEAARLSIDGGSVVWPTLGELVERGPLMPVPLDTGMRVGSGYLTPAEARRAVTVPLPFDPDALDLQWPTETTDAVEQYMEWLQAAADHGLGLFVHC